MRSAGSSRPSGRRTATCVAPWTTWLFVRMNRSGVKTTPDRWPGSSRSGRPGRRTGCRTSTLTTARPTRSTAPATAAEYASSGSSDGAGAGSAGSPRGASGPPIRAMTSLEKFRIPPPFPRKTPPRSYGSPRRLSSTSVKGTKACCGGATLRLGFEDALPVEAQHDQPVCANPDQEGGEPPVESEPGGACEAGQQEHGARDVPEHHHLPAGHQDAEDVAPAEAADEEEQDALRNLHGVDQIQHAGEEAEQPEHRVARQVQGQRQRDSAHPIERHAVKIDATTLGRQVA